MGIARHKEPSRDKFSRMLTRMSIRLGVVQRQCMCRARRREQPRQPVVVLQGDSLCSGQLAARSMGFRQAKAQFC